MTETILEVMNIRKSYKKRTILNNLSFKVNKGEIVALLGINGAGKSTLINSINQLIPLDAGTVTFFNQQNQPIDRQKIGVMMQKNIQLSRLTIKETLTLAASYYHKPLPYTKLIALANLAEHENKRVAKLSGGQKRRLSFAVALAGDPQLIFLDEPTAGMDSSSRQKLWQVISLLKKEGKTFFVTSHYLDELESSADRLLILKESNIVFDGTLEDLRRKSGTAEITFHSKLSEKIFTEWKTVLSVTRTGEFIHLMTNQVNQVVVQLVPYLSGIENLVIKQNSLESLFVSLNEGGGNHA